MRLARLAVLGLAVGVIAGFAIALLRTRPLAATEASPPLAGPDPRPTEAARPATATATDEVDAAAVLDVRTHRRVIG